MPYPAVPDLKPFEGQQRPSLLAGGPYDEQLTAIEDYLKSLGAYVDGELATLDTKIDEVEQTLTAKIDALADNVAAIVTSLSGVTYTYAETSYALFEGLTSTGGTVTSPALEQISTQLAEDASSLEELSNEVNGLSQVQSNMLGVEISVPGPYINDTFIPIAFRLFNPDGQTGSNLSYLKNVLTNLALAAPNGDHTQVLGDVGADLTSRPSVRSSAALTYAAEQPAYEGNVYNVPVSIDASGLVRLDVEGEFVIHAGETLFVVQSEYESFAEGSLLGYSGTGATLNNDGVNIVGDLLTLFSPASGEQQLTIDDATGTLLKNGTPVNRLTITSPSRLYGVELNAVDDASLILNNVSLPSSHIEIKASDLEAATNVTCSELSNAKKIDLGFTSSPSGTTNFSMITV